MPLLWLCRWRWRSVPERRGAATARLFLPSVHCETVTGAKMADNREEISELVEKRGIYRYLSVAIPSRRDDSTSLSRECCRGDASSPLIIATRHATLIAAAALRPRPRGARGPSMSMNYSPGNCSRVPEEYARFIVYDRRESYRETRDVSVTSRHPSATAVSVVVRSPSPSLIRRDQTRQRLTVRDLAIGVIHE